jgi:hypothetical protein
MVSATAAPVLLAGDASSQDGMASYSRSYRLCLGVFLRIRLSFQWPSSEAPLAPERVILIVCLSIHQDTVPPTWRSALSA